MVALVAVGVATPLPGDEVIAIEALIAYVNEVLSYLGLCAGTV